MMTSFGKWLAAAVMLAAASPASSQLQPEELVKVELADSFQPHWVWLNDVSFDRMADGRAYLIDADRGVFLGMVSGGLAHNSLQLAPDGKSFAVPGTFYSRHSRGDRVDALTFYDAKTLTPGEEVLIPSKRFQAMAFLGSMPVTDDGRFSIIYNFTPEQSLTIVDMKEKKLVGEFPTAGCALAYPTGARSFLMQCADGSISNMKVDEAGLLTQVGASDPLFEERDPANEKPVRVGLTRWMFFTFDSEVREVEGSGAVPTLGQRWSLLGPEDKAWRIGGIQPAAYHAPTKRLFVLMHEGSRHTHKDPGTEIWVYDVSKRVRIARFKMDGPATSINISGDANPLLYTVMAGSRDLSILDPASGKKLRTVDGLGATMTTIQPAPVPGALARW